MNKILCTLALIFLSAQWAAAAQQTILGGAAILWGNEKVKINSNFTELYGQAFDADVTDLVDGSLTGTKVGFADTDNLFTATNIQAAVEEFNDSINAGAPNGTGAKVHWSQLLGVPAGFEDGTDDGGSGTIPDGTADNQLLQWDSGTSAWLATSTLAGIGNITGAGTYNNITVTQPATGATLTLVEGSTLATSGAYSITLTSTAATNVTLPTSGTLATQTWAQQADSDLTTWAGVTPSSNGQSLVAAANYAAMRGLLDLEADTDFAAYGKNPVVIASKATTYTIGTDSANELFGGTIYVTSATTITAPAVAAGQNFTVVTIGDIAVSLDVDASDKMILDGVALADGDKATNSSKAGDTITCQYYSADGFYCWSGTVLGGHWTDGN